MGIKVHRPKPKFNAQNIQISDFNISLATAPIVPRDQYLVYGEVVYQTYTSLPDRYIDSLSYYDIFLDLYKQGHNWISQPPPELENVNNLGEEWAKFGKTLYSERYVDKVLWHAACMFKYGDTLLSNTSPGTALGLEWMRRNTPHQIITQDKFGHIDHGFFNINDDVILCDTKEWVPDVLQNKTIYPISVLLDGRRDYSVYVKEKAATPGKLSDAWMDRWLTEWKGYFQEVSFDFNPLVIDPNNIIFTNHQPKLFKLLDSLGVNSHVCNIRHGQFWDAGMHCLTLDLKRRGECRQIIN